MENTVRQFKELLKKQRALDHAMSVLNYDSETVMPKMGAAQLGSTMGYLSGESYRLSTGPEMRELIGKLSENKDKLDHVTACEVRELKEKLEKLGKIPMDEYIAYRALVSRAGVAWRQAKAENDFSKFAPHLEQLVEFNRKKAEYYDPSKPKYDVLLNEFERDLTTEALDEFFALVRSNFAPLIKEIAERGSKFDDSALKAAFPVWKQRELGKRIAYDLMKIDPDRCILGEVEHPFTGGVSKNDVRLTTHYYENNVLFGVFSVAHEGGHAIYELNIGDDIADSPLGGGVSMGIHESQSRFYENMIGRSYEFIEKLHPVMCDIFPEEMKGVDVETLYRAGNKAVPGCIRLEADELTYSMHIMVRYELEKQLIADTLKVKDLPEAWNAMYKEYLGVDVPNDSKGVLQDTHWSGGSFGYFPSYSIGSAYAAQIYDSMMKEIDVPAAVRAGEIEKVTAWLTDRIYKYGSTIRPAEVIMNACGEEFDPNHYINYLTGKFRRIYGL